MLTSKLLLLCPQNKNCFKICPLHRTTYSSEARSMSSTHLTSTQWTLKCNNQVPSTFEYLLQHLEQWSLRIINKGTIGGKILFNSSQFQLFKYILIRTYHLPRKVNKGNTHTIAFFHPLCNDFCLT